MRSLLIATLVLGAACHERELGDVSKSEATMVYTTVRSTLRDVHLLVLGGGGEPPREPFEYACPSGGIELRVGVDENMQPASLRHMFEACSVDGLTFSGEMDYVNLDPCNEATGEFSYSGGGIVDLSGSMNGFCYIEVRDECGAVSGHICGFPANEVFGAP